MQVQEEEFAPACMQRSEETAFADANHLFDAHAGRNSLSPGQITRYLLLVPELLGSRPEVPNSKFG